MSNLSELLPSGGAQNVVDFVASGTLPNGKPVILNSNGTITAVAESSVNLPQAIPAGSSSVFASGAVTYIRMAFDPNNANKFVVAYEDSANSYYGTAVVGTVSGTSISFGSTVVFNASNSIDESIGFDPNNANTFVISYRDYGDSSKGKAIVGTVSGTSISFGTAVVYSSTPAHYGAMAFDPNNANKFVISYRNVNNSNYGTSLVGTVSGTSISFGSTAVFNSGTTADSSIAFDPNVSGKFVIAYGDQGNSNYGTAIVGTVSGTSISYGSESIFESAASLSVAIAFDPNNANKFVVTYSDGGDSNKGQAVVGTVSGTSISFGSIVVFNNATTFQISMAFDPNNANKFVVAYINEANSYYGTAIVGTVSGTSISFGTASVFVSASVAYTSTAFDPNVSGKFVISYRDQGNSNYGTAIVGQIAATVTATNLTATNLIGISAEAIASGATGEVNVLGGLNEGQSSLTPASIYYVQGNGSISTVATAPAQKIGKAMSATTLNIKDL